MATASNQITVTGLKDLKKRIALGGLAYTPIRKFYNEVGKHLKEEARQVLDDYDKNDTGTLKKSIKYSRRTAKVGALPKGVKVMATAKYASFVHGDVKMAFKGKYKLQPKWSRTTPHMPPVRALKGWAGRKLGDEGAAYGVALGIAKKGTPIVPFLKIAYDRSDNDIDALLLLASNRIERNWKKSRKGKI
jgi:hypothetical protein